MLPAAGDGDQAVVAGQQVAAGARVEAGGRVAGADGSRRARRGWARRAPGREWTPDRRTPRRHSRRGYAVVRPPDGAWLRSLLDSHVVQGRHRFVCRRHGVFVTGTADESVWTDPDTLDLVADQVKLVVVTGSGTQRDEQRRGHPQAAGPLHPPARGGDRRAQPARLLRAAVGGGVPQVAAEPDPGPHHRLAAERRQDRQEGRHPEGRGRAPHLAARPARDRRDPDPAQGHPRLLGLRPLAADGGRVRRPADEPDDAAPPRAGRAVARHGVPRRHGPPLPPPARDHQRGGLGQRGVRDRARDARQPAGVRAVLRPDRRLARRHDAGRGAAGADVQRHERPPPGRRLHRRRPQPLQARLGGSRGRPEPRRPRRPLVGRDERPGRDRPTTRPR